MTDITDQDRRAARAWAKNWQGDLDADTSAAARVILATVDAPAPTLAEELRGQAEWSRRIGAPCNAEKIDSLAARAEQMERDLEEARAAQMEHDIEELRAEATALAEDLAGAESEVERLTAERDRLEAAQYLSDGSAWGGPVREPTVQKGAESNAESIDPADVKPGEPWLIRVRGRDAVAIRDGHEEWPWSVAFIHGESDEAKDDVVTLVSRLVPAPRVITNPEELRALPTGAAIEHDGTAWLRRHLDSHLDFETTNRYGKAVDLVPAIVLWEPEA